jgi:hypothetical protein
MADFRLPVQDAVVAALMPLDGTVVDGKPVRVLQHVPQTNPPVQPPLIVVGSIETTPIGGKDGDFDSVTFTVETYYRGPARRFLLAMQADVRGQIEGQQLPAQAGVLLSEPVLDGADDALLEDGLTYSGTQKFTLFAQPAS